MWTIHKPGECLKGHSGRSINKAYPNQKDGGPNAMLFAIMEYSKCDNNKAQSKLEAIRAILES